MTILSNGAKASALHAEGPGENKMSFWKPVEPSPVKRDKIAQWSDLVLSSSIHYSVGFTGICKLSVIFSVIH